MEPFRRIFRFYRLLTSNYSSKSVDIDYYNDLFEKNNNDYDGDDGDGDNDDNNDDDGDGGGDDDDDDSDNNNDNDDDDDYNKTESDIHDNGVDCDANISCFPWRS